MLYLKGCPKCRGDVYLDRDGYGAFLTCLQCGRTSDLPEDTPSLERAARLKIEECRKTYRSLDGLDSNAVARDAVLSTGGKAA